MSSGACRALVAVLLTIVATIVMTLPIAAKTESLNERSTVTYWVHPATGKIDVSMIFNLKTRQSPWQPQEWGPIVVEERARPSVSSGFELVPGANDLPGLWKAVSVETPRIDGGAQTAKFVLSYTIDGRITQSDTRKAGTPARVDGSYFYVCVPGQDTDSGSVRIRVDDPNRWRVTQTGTVLEKANYGLKSETSRVPTELFTCVEGVRENKLAQDTFIGPADRQIVLQAWQDNANWLSAAEALSEPVLDSIHRFLGHDIPGVGPVVVRQAPVRDLGGYANAHDTPGIVQLDEQGGTVDPEHQLAHAWFGTDNFLDLWLREGMALWTATAMSRSVCEPAGANALDLDLSDWQVVRPTSGEDVGQVIDAQDAAACGIVSAVASRMSEEQWREVIGSLLDGETKYIGRIGPEASSAIVDYREWLDAVDERGLVPAAADPAFAGNMDDLDFAQNLLDDYGVRAPELFQRSETRAYYHQFLADAAPLGAPLAVRKNMDDWNFAEATAALDKAYEVLNALKEADSLLPTAGLIPIIQNDFEAAADVGQIEAVLVEATDLLESATTVVEPLGALQSAAPPGWDFPAAIREAIKDRRFEDIMDAIPPAVEVVQEVSAAHQALPTAGLLERYELRYESTTSADKLSELADDAARVRRVAEATSVSLALLESEVGEWRVPSAVTDPIDRGQISSARTIIDDARAVVRSAKAADRALPEAQLGAGLRESFENVQTGAEMAALRAEAESRRDEAESVGNALQSLSTRVPGWQIPAVVTQPVEDADFATAAVAASAAQRWVENAYQADQDLPDINALERIRDDFEGAQDIQTLQRGADLAEQWAEAADHVGRAIQASQEPRDLLTEFGLWGVNVQPSLDEALEAAVDGRVSDAINRSADVISVLRNGSSSGALRLAGLVFVGVAVLGVLGLWVVLRRQSGPSWARQSTPHWVEKKDSRWGRPKELEKGKGKGKPKGKGR